MAIQISYYQEQDRQQLLELWASIFDETGAYNKPQYMLDSKLAIDNNIYVARQSEEVVGVILAGYDGHRGWLYSLAVSRYFQRKGVGKSLVEFALEKLMNMGCVKVNLQVREENKEVVSFYRSLGFTIEDRVSMGRIL